MSDEFAKWPPQMTTRKYLLTNGEQVGQSRRGRELPAAGIINHFHTRDNPEFHANLLESTALYVDVPAEFFEAYLKIQRSSTPIRLPAIMQNKNVTVGCCFARHSGFTSLSGPLNINNWENLGWASKSAYEQWLNTSMLFAFSHCMHYCSAPRVFEVDPDHSEGEIVHFRQILNGDEASIVKKTNILSVTGFEYRNFHGDIITTLPDVKKHSKITMEQILAVATITNTTDVVVIPYGMGVFIPRNHVGQQIKQFTFAGMVEALKEYEGPLITIHCCGGPDFYNALKSANNPNLNLEDKTGCDAYAVANNIQDRGDGGEMSAHQEAMPLKSMLINAADNDWTALLDVTKVPGQFSNNHTLYHSTSDEYYALVMTFAYFSIQRLMDFFKDTFLHKITYLNKPLSSNVEELTEEVEIESPFSLTELQTAKIDELIDRLNKEINSSWPFPNKIRKESKVSGLTMLKIYTTQMDLPAAIKKVEDEFPDIREGQFSQRTHTLLNTLADYGAEHRPATSMSI